MSRLTCISSWIPIGRTYKSYLNSNESFQCGELKFRLLLSRDFKKFTVLLKYIYLNFKKFWRCGVIYSF